ncbi:MAG: calcium/sodium antiporter [Acidobacteriota bacterium]|nr:MAG: sodium:calcium antiporter [Acidobacteriota bacterium]
MAALLDVAMLLASFLLLWKGAEWFVDSAARIGRAAGMSELVIGLTIVAFGTSAPEFAVTVAAAIGGSSEIAVANVVGSNIFNLGIILGGCALFSALEAGRAAVRRDGPLLVAVSLAVALALLDGRLTRLEGGLLFAGLLAYLLLLGQDRSPLEEEIPTGPATWLSGVRLVAGLAGVVAGGKLLVVSASDLAAMAGVPQWLIGLTIVAAGTSASELATSIVASRRGRHAIVVGNLVGSDIFNMLGVLGVAAMARPITLTEGGDYAFAFVSLVVTCLLVAVFLRTGSRISRREGLILVLVGVLRWAEAFVQAGR